MVVYKYRVPYPVDDAVVDGVAGNDEADVVRSVLVTATVAAVGRTG